MSSWENMSVNPEPSTEKSRGGRREGRAAAFSGNGMECSLQSQPVLLYPGVTGICAFSEPMVIGWKSIHTA